MSHIKTEKHNYPCVYSINKKMKYLLNEQIKDILMYVNLFLQMELVFTVMFMVNMD